MEMKGGDWWRSGGLWEKIFRGSMWLLAGLVIFSCYRAITFQQTTSNLLSDSTYVARGKPGERMRLDTTNIDWKEIGKQVEAGNADMPNKLRQLYSENQFKTYWLGSKAPTEYYYELVKILARADDFGLQGSRYDLRSLEEEMKQVYEGERDPLAIATLDFQITGKFFLFARHLSDGRIRRTGFGKSLWKNPRMPDVYKDVMVLTNTKKPAELERNIEELKPANEQYKKLEKAYQRYLNLARQYPRIKHIVIRKKIRPNDRHDMIPEIRRRIALHSLRESNDSVAVADSLRYDETMVTFVKQYQLRHGLAGDGVIGGKTIAYLNRTFADMAELVALNMERLRWQHHSHHENYITVNIPEYVLRVFDNEQESLRMKVVVGNPETPTPVFSDVMEHIVFAPTWTIPTSIIKDEVIPRLQEDPDYYSERNYVFKRKGSEEEVDPLDERWDEEVDPYDYVIVQQPGEDNALGRVKFVMPNNLSIYLHDTPQKRLFQKHYRAFSHGCIRVHEPAKLAAHLLRDNQKWSEKAIAEAMSSVEPKTVRLKRHYVVHLQYQTVWVDADGLPHFRDDVYGHDQHQLTQLYATPGV